MSHYADSLGAGPGVPELLTLSRSQRRRIAATSILPGFLSLAEDLEMKDYSQYHAQAVVAHAQRSGASCHQNVCYYPEFYYGGNV